MITKQKQRLIERNELNRFCEDCGCALCDENTVEIELVPPSEDYEPDIIYVCLACSEED